MNVSLSSVIETYKWMNEWTIESRKMLKLQLLGNSKGMVMCCIKGKKKDEKSHLII